MSETTPQPNADRLSEIRNAAQQFSKLPILGPALWLYARDSARKYLFLADIDSRLMPPLVLDQCRIWFREGIPWAFITWARVNDEVNQRLTDGVGRLAPHEWNSGGHAWLVDVVSPFEDPAPFVGELKTTELAGYDVDSVAMKERI